MRCDRLTVERREQPLRVLVPPALRHPPLAHRIADAVAAAYM